LNRGINLTQVILRAWSVPIAQSRIHFRVAREQLLDHRQMIDEAGSGSPPLSSRLLRFAADVFTLR
jgi:hypothetical protein